MTDHLPPSLSALVVAHNEEQNLPACLERLAFADEILVVLDRCTDGSKKICDRFGTKTLEGAWEIEHDRRNAGIDACSGTWILEVDADEHVTPALATEIRERIKTAAPGCYLIWFNNYVGSRHVAHGWGAYNGVSAKYALFSKGQKEWGKARVHPPITLTGAKGELDGRIDHYVDKDLTDMFARLNGYSLRAAQDMVESGTIPTRWKTFRRFFSRFYKSYVARKGYKERGMGVALALFSALYPVLSYLKAQELATPDLAANDEGV